MSCYVFLCLDKIIVTYNFFKDVDISLKMLFPFRNIDPFICSSVIFNIMNYTCICDYY